MKCLSRVEAMLRSCCVSGEATGNTDKRGRENDSEGRFEIGNIHWCAQFEPFLIQIFRFQLQHSLLQHF